MEHLPKHFCYGNEIMRSLCIFVDIHVAVNNIKRFDCVTETQEWVSLALLSKCKIFGNTIDNINTINSSCKVPDTVVPF